MKIGIIIPDRNDRPQFLKKCLEYISRQTLQPDFIELVNDKPIYEGKDITWRYKLGYQRLKEKGADVVLFFENDDWYANNYIQLMVNRWITHNKPLMLGLNTTTYYHIKTKRYVHLYHKERSSAMSMLLDGKSSFDFGSDLNPFTDLYLWKKYKGVLFTTFFLYNLGIKHGTGMTGGVSHNSLWSGYKETDPEGSYLKSIVGEEDYKFYNSI